MSGGSMLLGLCATTLGYAATWGTAAARGAGRARRALADRETARLTVMGPSPGGPAASAGRAALAARGAEDARRGRTLDGAGRHQLKPEPRPRLGRRAAALEMASLVPHGAPSAPPPLVAPAVPDHGEPRAGHPALDGAVQIAASPLNDDDRAGRVTGAADHDRVRRAAPGPRYPSAVIQASSMPNASSVRNKVGRR